MDAGTERIGVTGAGAPVTRCAARMTRLPVTWAVNRPPSPRKPMASALPAITLSTVGSNFVLSELSTDGVETPGVRRSAGADMCPTVICGATRVGILLLRDAADMQRNYPKRAVIVIDLARARGDRSIADGP